jgi:glycosyltransferase involved in cell wall biosynthesis
MLSIIIITLNEAKCLPLLLESIKRQQFNNYEIIVSDAGSKDKTVKLAKKYGCRIVKGGLPAAGRNNGAKAAKGETLLFLDADVILPPGFIDGLYNMMEEKKLVCATSFKKIDSKNPIDIIAYFIADIFFFATKKLWPRAPGTCIMIKRSIFEKLKFDESMHLSEDVDLVYRTKKHGSFDMMFSPKLIVSARRQKIEGRISYYSRMIKSTIYDISEKKITKKEVKYDYNFYNNSNAK